MTGHRSDGSARTGARGLHTDLYELRMVESYLSADMTAAATFTLYIRPDRHRPWFVALGVNRAVEALESFRYGREEIDYLRTLGFTDHCLDWLASFVPSGELWAVPDGTIILGDEPILEYTAPLPVAQLVETAFINVVQYATLVATKAARISLAARGRAVADFGFRRAHGLETGIEAAWAAYVGGGLTTSNVEAGRRFGLQVVGTMAHSFVQAFGDETESFRAFSRDHPGGTILLVDTYDTISGVRKAIEVAQEMRERGDELRAVRLDSGDLADLAKRSRGLLDDAGFPNVQIFASGGLDEEEIHRLIESGAPIDAFGVGTDLVTSKDRPAFDIAYKLAEYGGAPRAKFSEAKATLPGAKQVFRRGEPSGDSLGLRDEDLPGERLLEPVWRDGEVLRPFDLEGARERARKGLESLPEAWRRPPYPPDAPTPDISRRLRRLTSEVRQRATMA